MTFIKKNTNNLTVSLIFEKENKETRTKKIRA